MASGMATRRWLTNFVFAVATCRRFISRESRQHRHSPPRSLTLFPMSYSRPIYRDAARAHDTTTRQAVALAQTPLGITLPRLPTRHKSIVPAWERCSPPRLSSHDKYGPERLSSPARIAYCSGRPAMSLKTNCWPIRPWPMGAATETRPFFWDYCDQNLLDWPKIGNDTTVQIGTSVTLC